jgi:hypothetical protein
MYTHSMRPTTPSNQNPTLHKPAPRSTVRVNAGKSLGAIVLNLMRPREQALASSQKQVQATA